MIAMTNALAPLQVAQRCGQHLVSPAWGQVTDPRGLSGEGLHQFRTESGQVARASGWDTSVLGPSVDTTTSSVHPVRAGVAQMGLQFGPGRDGATRDDVGLDQGPGAVADHRDRLTGLEEALGETDRRGLGA